MDRFRISLTVALFLCLLQGACAGNLSVKSGQLNMTGNLYVGPNYLFVNSTSGLVGIGTTAPGTILEISSTNNPLAAGSASILLAGDVNKERVAIRSSQAAVFIAAGHRGTVTSPSALLAGDAMGYYQLGGYTGTGYTRAAWITGYAEENWNATNWGGNLIFSTISPGTTSITEKVRITGAGNVGIGTTNPAAKLHVNGDVRITGDSFDSIFINQGGALYISAPSSKKIYFDTTGVGPKVSFDMTSGNVGIGTTAPASKLQVSGGEIQTGTSGTACSGSNAGAIRWSGSHFYGCTGSFWIQLDSGAYSSCNEIKAASPGAGDGAYTIYPSGVAINVYCDMTTNGGGWTIVTAQSGAGQYGLADDTEATGNPLSYQAYNLNLIKKMYISSVSSESLIKRSTGAWIKASHALFDNNLVGMGNQHPHWQVTVTASNGATAANCQMGYSNFYNSNGGDFGITTSGVVFDHHNPSTYYHLNAGCASMYFYNYGTTYNVNTALGDWPVTNACVPSGTELGSWYAAMR
ncbi:MAG: fibrinogen-like YCDxxxxGGGW domain-containing protein [Candidatus Micrarchaeia archaeon]